MRYPNLELIEYKAKNTIKENFYSGEKDKYWFECTADVFAQTWGSTATGFDGYAGCSAITREYTTVCEIAAHSLNKLDVFYLIFFGNDLAYTIKNPNKKFFDDLKNRDMKPQSKADIYLLSHQNNDNEA